MSAASPIVTFVNGGDPVACDTGPGNALIDDFMRARTGAPLDRDGDEASRRARSMKAWSSARW